MSKESFKSIVHDWIKRDGISDLMEWLEKTDFYTAPASTRFHGACEGGLLAHSLSVYKWLRDALDGFSFCNSSFDSLSMESMAIVALFHDICKIGAYRTEYRNVKNPATGVWEQVPCYAYNTDTFGAHGAKSVFLLNQFIHLTEEETVAILHHMGAWDKSTYTDPGRAYENYPLAWLLHVADEAATYISKT